MKKKYIKILHVVGARPNFMKVAPVMRAVSKYKRFKQILVHTGQHYSANMSDVFFQQLDLPKPDYSLGVGSGTHTFQTAQVMIRFEKVVDHEKPSLVIVYGDVNSTVAAALVCAKKGIKIGHVEAGLRSFDREMPEETNRILTDHLCQYLFTPSLDGNQNLIKEGISAKKIFFVGNVMIDTLVYLEPKLEKPKIEGLSEKYVLVTLHRPSNVDDSQRLKFIFKELVRVSKFFQIIFPVHPRTKERLEKINPSLLRKKQILFTDPLGYVEFLSLEKNAVAVLTDSGGVQEETTYLGIPCFTLRDNTERPITLTIGTNHLLGSRPKELFFHLMKHKKRVAKIPALWDGKAAGRIANVLNQVI
ncbi:MAG TPA: UDP-N-acetylglucosamine 2-epimerase (non-hydrolyzing) [Candidatus Omnitrophota bacterium]|nr:UDP-N-acetylglucosamine 2-epimerase (non-hydrolyzing) [Candidatus Omnitrophota bacterium]